MNYPRSSGSCISITSSARNLARLFDFTAPMVPGLFKTTPKRFMLDYKEGSLTANLSLRTRKQSLHAELCEVSIIQYGIEYSNYIKITHENNEEFLILIPDARSYNPSEISKPYITAFEYLFITKFISIEIRAACMGVYEEKIDSIKEKIKNISIIYPKIKEIIEWVHLQIICACYKKTAGPKFYEVVIRASVVGEIILNGNDHCKEYLENCISGEEVFLPALYYKSVLESEPNLSFKKKSILLKLLLEKIKNLLIELF